jgi:[FeFe] hydrogenase H-cluster maturation GTPase HydF
MQETPKGSRLHIAIFGRRNAGKSSLINALTNQDIALVSDVPGTTADPVYKAMEILPIGPVMMIDTAGIDDIGKLGELRVERSMQVLNKADLALIVIDPAVGLSQYEAALKADIRKRSIPYITVVNKADVYDIAPAKLKEWQDVMETSLLKVSAASKLGIEELKKLIIENAPDDWEGSPIIGDLINPGDSVLLVVPIDLAAPKGRLILPQVYYIL